MLKLKSIQWEGNNELICRFISYFFSLKALSLNCMDLVVGFFSSLDYLCFKSIYQNAQIIERGI